VSSPGVRAASRGSLLLLIVVQASGCAVTRSVLLAEKRAHYKFEASSSPGDPEFLHSMEAFGNKMVPGNKVELLNNGVEFFPAMLRDIAAARKSVNLEIYAFRNDKAGQRFAEGLAAAARRGVEVRLLVDGHGSKLGPLREMLQQAGVNVQTYRPVTPLSIFKIGRRTHRKILVVDGAISYTGGFGIAERWLGDARNQKEWRDCAVRVTGPVVGQMQGIFGEDWTFTTGEILVGENLFPRNAPAGGVLAQAVKASRGDATSVAKMLYYVAISSAKKSITLQNAYFVPDKQMREALAAAARRGVDVRIMVPGPHIDMPLVRLAGRGKYGDLLEAGVKIYEYQPSMLHSKVLVVDGLFSTVGSINFDVRSMISNAEESFIFYDKDVAARLEASFRRDLAHARDVSYDRWKKRGLDKRFAEALSTLGTPLY